MVADEGTGTIRFEVWGSRSTMNGFSDHFPIGIDTARGELDALSQRRLCRGGVFAEVHGLTHKRKAFSLGRFVDIARQAIGRSDTEYTWRRTLTSAQGAV